MEELKNCIICGREIHRANNPKSPFSKRGRKWVTCSKNCSRTYIRVYRYLKQKTNRKKLKRKKELEEFASEVKRRIRNVGRSHQIDISEIDELIVRYNIKYEK